MLCALPADARALVLLHCDARSLASVGAVSRELAEPAREAMADPAWAVHHKNTLLGLLWLRSPPAALVLPLRGVWASYGVASNLAHALPHACGRLTAVGCAVVLKRLRTRQGQSSIVSYASVPSGSSRERKRGPVLPDESSDESENDTYVAVCEIKLRERASREPKPSPGDPATTIVLRLSEDPPGGLPGQAWAPGRPRARASWAIVKETRYRDTRLQKALCGFEPQTTRRATPAAPGWHARACPRHPLRGGGITEAEWRADPGGAAARVWIDALDYACCCHVDWQCV